MKRLFIVILLLTLSTTSFAQSFEDFKKQSLQEYYQYKQKSTVDFEDFRKKANKEYAEYMRKTWDEFQSQPARPIPERPEPPTPVIKDPNTEPLKAPQPLITPEPKSEPKPEPKLEPKPTPKPEPKPEPKLEPKPTPKPEPKPEPKLEPKPTPKPEPKPAFSFDYYGTVCSVNLDNSYRFKLSEVSNTAIADVWDIISSDKYFKLVEEVEELRNKLSLCDWGYVKLTEFVTQALFGASSVNEARILQAFILTQSGYKIRLAYCDNKVIVLLGSESTIYQYPIVSIDDTEYFALDTSLQGNNLYIHNREFPRERFCNLEKVILPKLKSNLSKARTLRTRKYPNITFDIAVNKNLIDFYSDYPMIDWRYYVNTPLSDGTRNKLYNILRSAISSKSKTEAANILINFVQTAFEYKTDQEQFGIEKPLFAEETLFYPYSDCEDRAILFALLTKDLLGLDVILLHYPNHLATAVNFGHDIPGSYIDYNNKRYFVCDPTYIGASIGEAMPHLENSKITIIEIE